MSPRAASSSVPAPLAAGIALAVQVFVPVAARPEPAAAQTRAIAAAPAAERLGALPMGFEPNVGQFDEAVEFVARAGGYTLFLSPGESVVACRRAGGEAPDLASRRRAAEPQRGQRIPFGCR